MTDPTEDTVPPDATIEEIAAEPLRPADNTAADAQPVAGGRAIEVVFTGEPAPASSAACRSTSPYVRRCCWRGRMNTANRSPTANGGPVRLVVPGWAGASPASSGRFQIDVVLNTPFAGYWNAERYIMVDATGRRCGPCAKCPVKSVIVWPGHGAELRQGTYTVFLFAWSGFGEIKGVDVSTDDQRTWSPARLTKGEGPLAWSRWEVTWTPRARTARDAGRPRDAPSRQRATGDGGLEQVRLPDERDTRAHHQRSGLNGRRRTPAGLGRRAG